MSRTGLVLLWGILCICVFAGPAGAQDFVEGYVHDESGIPLACADVALMRGRDSSVIAQVKAGDNGRYRIGVGAAAAGNLLRASISGYREHYLELSGVSGFDFILSRSGGTLEEVAVADTRPLMERKADRLIFNLSSRSILAGGTAVDALKKIPGVMVKEEEQTLQLAGRGAVQVLVNDRLLPLAGADLLAYLQAIPAGTIERVELITAPPAQYDASGNTGLLHIVLKKSRKAGLNGDLRIGYEQASLGKGLLGGQLNYRSGKLNLYGNADYSRGRNHVTERLATPYPEQLYAVTDAYRKQQEPLQYSAGADFEPDSRNLLGFQCSSNRMARTDASVSDILVTRPALSKVDSSIRTLGDHSRNNRSLLVNVNYVRKLDTAGGKLSLNVSRLWYEGKRNHDFRTRHFAGSFGQPLGEERKNLSQGQQRVRVSTFQADVEKTVSGIVLTAGVKLSFTGNRSTNRFLVYNRDSYVEDTAISNAFRYGEQVQAFYAGGQKQLGPWTLQAGLRAEYTQTEGISLKQPGVVHNRYLDFFPALYLQYHHSADLVGTFSYSKRIHRPDYRSLDPYRAYATPYHYQEGNPFLKPSFNHNMELGYTWRGKYTLSAFGQYERRHFGSVWQVDTAANITSGTSMNFADVWSCGLQAAVVMQPAPWCELQLSLSGQQQVLRSAVYTTVGTSYSQRMGYAGATGNFSFNRQKTLLGEVNLFVLSRYRDEFLEISALGSLDIGLKAVLSPKCTIALSGNDLLATQKARGLHLVTRQAIDNYFDSRNLRISLVYKPGNAGVKGRHERDTGVEEEKKRAGG